MKNWRPREDKWGEIITDAIQSQCKDGMSIREIAEIGADAMYEAIMKARPSDGEIRVRIIEALYGGTSVPELERWLKEMLLIK